MFGFVYMTLTMLDELCWWMRCRQLRREAREATERFLELFDRHIENPHNRSLYTLVL
jgi:hypothetical protein